MKRIFLAGDFAMQSKRRQPIPVWVVTSAQREHSWKALMTACTGINWRLWIGLVLCGIAFGYIEAAVVVYLRGFYEPMHQRLYPDRAPGDLLPLIPLEDWQTLGVSA